MPNLETDRLIIIDFLPESAAAAAKGLQHLKEIFPYEVSEQWQNPDFAEILTFLSDSLAGSPEASKWTGLSYIKKNAF